MVVPTLAAEMKFRLLPTLAGVISSVWASSALVGYLTKDYTPLGITTTVMLVVITAVFTVKSNNGNGGHK